MCFFVAFFTKDGRPYRRAIHEKHYQWYLYNFIRLLEAPGNKSSPTPGKKTCFTNMLQYHHHLQKLWLVHVFFLVFFYICCTRCPYPSHIPSSGASAPLVEVSVEESCEKLKATADRQKSILLELVSRLQSSGEKNSKPSRFKDLGCGFKSFVCSPLRFRGWSNLTCAGWFKHQPRDGSR